MLLSPDQKLQVVLAGAITTNQLPIIASYAEAAADSSTLSPASNTYATNSTTAVDVVTAPENAYRRSLRYLSVYNADTVDATVIVQINDSGTTRIVCKVSLPTLARLEYTPDSGFRAMNGGTTLSASVIDSIADSDTTNAPSRNAVFDALALKGDKSGKLSQFAATSSAELAGVISDETGSGALVFGTSPTLSNPVVGTQSAGDNSTKAASTAYADAAAAAVVVDSIADSDTTHAPSRNAVFDALALKAPLASPTFTGTVSGITATMVGLGSVTNDAQTKAVIVPNTAPSAGQLLVGNAGGTAYAPVSASGDVTVASTGAVTIANGAVTLAKQADMATASVVYRKTAGSGAPEVQTLATLKSDLGLSGTNTGDQDLSGYVPTTRTVNGHALSANVTVTKSDVSLGSVTDDAQTKAVIVPNTAPSAGQILVGNAGGTAYAPVTASGDVTIASTGAMSLAAPLIFVSTVSAKSLANDTSTQNIFASANDALTVEASTTYAFEGVIRVTNGSTSHTTSFGFGGTATLTDIGYDAMSQRVGAGNNNGTFSGRWMTSASQTATDAAGTSLGWTLKVRGLIRVNAGGTLIPQMSFSADPTGTCQVEPDSYMVFRKIGSNTVASVGAWA